MQIKFSDSLPSCLKEMRSADSFPSVGLASKPRIGVGTGGIIMGKLQRQWLRTRILCRRCTLLGGPKEDQKGLVYSATS